jgi:hypothetical protein
MTAPKLARPSSWAASIAVLAVVLALSLPGCGDPGPTVLTAPNARVTVYRPITLTDAARLPENDAAFGGVEVEEDRLVLHYSGRPEIPLSPGDVVSGVRGGGYLRRIVAVETTADQSVVTTTEPAFLTDLILDGHFVVEGLPAADDWREVESIGQATDALTSGPPLEPAVSGGVTLQKSLLPPAAEGITCGVGREAFQVHPIFRLPAIKPTIEIDMHPSSNPILRALHVGKLRKAKFQLDGEATVGWQLTSGPNVETSCSIDLIEWLESKGLEFPSLVFPLEVPVGPVLLHLAVVLKPRAGIDDTAQFAIQTEQEAITTFELSIGERYDDGEWTPIWAFTRNPSARQSTDGAFSVTAQISAGIEATTRVWGTLGLSADLDYAIRYRAHGDGSSCGWALENGLIASVGASAKFDLPLLFDAALFDVTFPVGEAMRQVASEPCLPCPESRPLWNADSLRCEPCPIETPTWIPAVQACGGGCPGGTESGGDAPVKRAFDVGSSEGVFVLSYDHYDIHDETIVEYEGKVLYSTGCVGGSGKVPIFHQGSSSIVVVRVNPNCALTSGTAWNFSVSCSD